MPPFYAHSTSRTDRSDWQKLSDHLRGVAEKAAMRARECGVLPGLPELAAAAGLLHDLGKYRPEFQAYITIPGSHVKGDPLTFHKQAGAAKAEKLRPVAFAIAGHHGGIPDCTPLNNLITGPHGKAVAEAVWSTAVADCFALRVEIPPIPKFRDAFQTDLFTRVLFSCLVDADWSDTNAHQRLVVGLSAEPDPPSLAPAERLLRVEEYIAALAARPLEKHVKDARAEVLTACLAEAERPPGLFSLTVPTGGGKTLAGLAFALKHANHHKLHGFKRVIYVAPYMTILEQNADVIRAALGIGDADLGVFEQYSLAEPVGDDNPEETRVMSAARRAENWDAPVIVTTNVQFFESLFSNKPSKCRKLHNIAKSVIILDECQTLPPGFVSPTCGMLRQLAIDLGSTVVLCTATQPAFKHNKLQDDERLEAREIVPDTKRLFGLLKRVRPRKMRITTSRN